MKFRGRMKTRIAPAVLGEAESGKTSQRLLQLLMQRSLGGSERRQWLRGLSLLLHSLDPAERHTALGRGRGWSGFGV